MVREFQSVIGRETRTQIAAKTSRLPDVMVACVGGGSNSIGFFNEFLDEPSVKMVGAEAGGTGDLTGQHASRIALGAKTGIVQGYKSKFLQNEEGQLSETHSISAGLDYAGIGPELAYLADQGRIQFVSVRDHEVLEAFQFFARHEGIIAAMESSHALSAGMKIASGLTSDQIVVINISGRGDKDIFITARAIGNEKWFQFLKDEVDRHEKNQ
jgi:tryptophan synthase beta chain